MHYYTLKKLYKSGDLRGHDWGWPRPLHLNLRISNLIFSATVVDQQVIQEIQIPKKIYVSDQ